MKSEDILAQGRRVIEMERDALGETARRLGDGFVKAVDLIATCRGRVIVSGVGKSGHIGRKIAATLTSTGTAATFMHPVEGLHGDIGIVSGDDVAILISKSGETDELVTLLGHLKRFGARVVAMTAVPESTLARESDAVLDAWVREEACPHDLAPTTSTTIQAALGDALAVVILERKGFRREDFARLHPGGTLGRKLLTRVQDLMERQRLPILPPSATLREAIIPLAERRGIVIVANGDGTIGGVFTAGDLTRLLEREDNFLPVILEDVMTRSPKVARAEELASAVVYRMEQFGIMAMPVLDDADRVVGVVHLHDLMRAGVV
ncbi:MAG TPA: KpsF/GutQ family sugar-phosphate isomerase [Gemmatimonadaceae bacterium]|nr:KpsF/GutQ family sugar-phosphate isomerase [Gemmatimonadaceae bacterium]